MKRAFFAVVGAVLVVSAASYAVDYPSGSSKVRITNDQEISGLKRFPMGLQVGDAGQNPTTLRLSKAASLAIYVGDVDGGTNRDITMTLTGAAVNDPLACSYPSNLPINITGTCFVSATNTVTFRLRNTDGTNQMTLDGGASSIYAARILR